MVQESTPITTYDIPRERCNTIEESGVHIKMSGTKIGNNVKKRYAIAEYPIHTATTMKMV